MNRPGSGETWPAIVAEHTPGLYRLAWQMLGSRADAEDVVQETFLRAFVALEKRGLVVRTSLRAYLGRIAVNLCYDRHRRGRRQELPSGEVEEVAGLGRRESGSRDAWGESGPEQALIHGDQARELRQALGNLPPNHRAAVLLRYTYDLSYREIAAALEVPENTVATWLHRAHSALRRHLTQEEARP